MQGPPARVRPASAAPVSGRMPVSVGVLPASVAEPVSVTVPASVVGVVASSPQPTIMRDASNKEKQPILRITRILLLGYKLHDPPRAAQRCARATKQAEVSITSRPCTPPGGVRQDCRGLLAQNRPCHDPAFDTSRPVTAFSARSAAAAAWATSSSAPPR
jgi:hypothetical protein